MDTITNNPEGYSPREVAKILTRDYHTVMGYIWDGRLKADNLNPAGKNALWVIRPDELKRFIEEHRRTVVVYNKKESRSIAGASP